MRRGLVQVTQGKEAFPGMTVEENLQLGAYVVRDRAKTAAALERVYGYFPILKEQAPASCPERSRAGSCRWSASGAA